MSAAKNRPANPPMDLVALARYMQDHNLTPEQIMADRAVQDAKDARKAIVPATYVDPNDSDKVHVVFSISALKAESEPKKRSRMFSTGYLPDVPKGLKYITMNIGFPL